MSTHFKDWPVSIATRSLMEKGADIFIRFNEGLSILKKVMAFETAASVVAQPMPAPVLEQSTLQSAALKTRSDSNCAPQETPAMPTPLSAVAAAIPEVRVP